MVSYRLNIRKIERSDIPYLVKWGNNHAHIKFFHGYLPKNESEGNKWFQRSLLDKSREDFVICATEEGGNKYPVGMLGLTNIDDTNRKAEYYIVIGNEEFLRRGIAYRTSSEMIKATCFKGFELNKVYVRVDKENYPAQKLVEKLGFRKEGIMLSDIALENGTFADMVYYGMLSSDSKAQ